MSTLQEETKNFRKACIDLFDVVCQELGLYKFIGWLENKLRNSDA